jgi:hypothetical protein
VWIHPLRKQRSQVRQTANTPNANLIPRLWVDSSFFNTALDAEPSASSPYFLGRPPPHLVWAKHLMMFIFFCIFAFVLRMCSFQFILVSKINPKILCFLTCSIFVPLIHIFSLSLSFPSLFQFLIFLGYCISSTYRKPLKCRKTPLRLIFYF